MCSNFVITPVPGPRQLKSLALWTRDLELCSCFLYCCGLSIPSWSWYPSSFALVVVFALNSVDMSTVRHTWAYLWLASERFFWTTLRIKAQGALDAESTIVAQFDQQFEQCVHPTVLVKTWQSCTVGLIRRPFPHHGIASLAQASAMSMCRLHFELFAVKSWVDRAFFNLPQVKPIG